MRQRLRSLAEVLVGADRPAPGWLRVLALAVLILLGAWYATTAVRHGRANNTIVEYNDQRVYLNYARSFAVFGFDFMTPRMRMPMYGAVLSLAARGQHVGGEYDEMAFFLRAQAFNVGLSLVCLVALFLVLRRWLGDGFALCLVLMIAFQLYLLRSAYVQPEILLTTVMTITIAQLIETLRNPRWWNAMFSGLLLCAWFLTKASAQGVLGIFGVILIIKWLTAGRGRRMALFTAGVIVIASYLMPMTPYLYTSWKIFHSPFYNAQSKYYMWGESEADKHYLQSLHIDTDLNGLPSDPSALPSAGKYFHEHSFKQIRERVFKGLEVMFKLAFNDYPLLYFMLAMWAGLVVWAACRRWPDSMVALWQRRWEAVFVIIFISVFTLLFGWFTPIHVGPRLIVSVTIPALFVCVGLTAWLLRGEIETIGGLRVSLQKLVVVLFLLFWCVGTFRQAPADMTIGFFAG